jgi:hypothetical protein
MAPTDDEGRAPGSVSAPCRSSSSKRIAEPQVALKMGLSNAYTRGHMMDVVPGQYKTHSPEHDRMARKPSRPSACAMMTSRRVAQRVMRTHCGSRGCWNMKTELIAGIVFAFVTAFELNPSGQTNQTAHVFKPALDQIQGHAQIPILLPSKFLLPSASQT